MFSVVMEPCRRRFRASEVTHILDEDNYFVDSDSNIGAEVNNMTIASKINPGEPKTCFIFRKKLNCVYNGYSYRLTKHKKVNKKKFKDIFRAHVNLYSD